MATAAASSTLTSLVNHNSSSSNTNIVSRPSSCCSSAASLAKWMVSSSRSSGTSLAFSSLHTLHGSPSMELPLYRTFSSRLLPCAVSDSGSLSTRALESDDNVPMPMVLIDQDSDPNATVVELSFGDRLGALLDTMKALKDLGLDVLKGNVLTDASVIRTKFFITRSDTGRKVENPELIEAVRLTVIRNLLKYHPESSERLAMGEAWGIKAPVKKVDIDVATHIRIVDDGPKRSLLTIETADRPGLLMEMVQIMNDVNVIVESAEIDTEGLVAKDKFHVSYHGQALNKSMAEVLTNCLRYHLRRPITDDESY